MKVVILAGGKGTRLSEETEYIPKPMTEIGNKPLLWHIMKIYSAYGFNDFIICLGYKGNIIKNYFKNYYFENFDFLVDLSNNKGTVLNDDKSIEDWKITLVDTGLDTLTGTRIKKIAKYLGDEPFMVTYGDGVSDIDINKLINFHKQGGKISTVTGVSPIGRYGAMHLENDFVASLEEKKDNLDRWINGGFFVFNKEFLNYIKEGEEIMLEDVLKRVIQDKQLKVYKHTGFWHAVDKLHDKKHLCSLWDSDNPPWKIWKE